ncbi:hypothetical protein ACROYT_G012677 [Oculina patagonica]
MDDLHLLDFIELRLKSKEDFDIAYDVVMNTGLAAYMRKFIVFQPGDWPCQFYCRQNAYETFQKFIGCHPGLTDAPQEHDNTLADHCSYSFPLTTGTVNNPTEDSLPTNTTSQPSILSIVPTIGPLHISLNSREHIVNCYHPFFKTVYETIFPRSKLADKPKPWRVSLILEIVYGGWTLIRGTVITKFSRFKDVEYGTLFNLLDNYIPLVLSIYSISFKLNKFSEYFRAMIRIWIMFTCLSRRHYNKAPLVWINMCSHWGKYAPQLYNLLKNYITIFDEYPVENTHSILRSQTKDYDTPDDLRKKAKSIFQSKEKQSHFRSFFTAPKQFSFSHNQLQFLKVKCAQLLSTMFRKISQGPGQSRFSSQSRSSTSAPTHVTLPTMAPNSSMKTNVLPLGYHADIKPDPTKKCDLPECNMSTQEENWTILHGCCHSFHDRCLAGSTSCPLCKDFLKQKVNELGEIAKQAILHPASTTHGVPESGNDHTNQTTPVAADDDHSNEITCLREMEREEYDNIIQQLNNDLANLNPASQPFSSSDLGQGSIPSTRTPSPSKAPPHCRKCHHPVRGHKRFNNNSQVKCNFCDNSLCTASNDVNCSKCPCSWHKANQGSQSSTNDQPASTPRSDTLRISVTQKQYLDVTEWLMPSAMIKGNQIYSSFNMPAHQPNLDVRQVLQQNDQNFQKLEIIADMGFFSVEDLEDYLVEYHQLHPNFAAVLIVPPDKTMVLCFNQKEICLFESHKHGLHGGVVATSVSGNISNFVRYLQIMVIRDWQTQLQGANLAILGLK